MNVRYEVGDRIATITIDRPQRLNALDLETQIDLAETWLRFRDDDSAWVAIITGAGERAFSAGFDLKKSGVGDPQGRAPDFWLGWHPGQLQTERPTWKPIVAAINGYCLGMGLTIAVACDLRLASETASFGYPEVQVGLATNIGAITTPQVIPTGAALELLLTGERRDAAWALRVGLVNGVVPPEDLMAAARQLAARLAANAPIAVRVTKEIAYRGRDMPFEHAVRLGTSLQRLCGQTQDAAEGPHAFAEKRAPRWEGR